MRVEAGGRWERDTRGDDDDEEEDEEEERVQIQKFERAEKKRGEKRRVGWLEGVGRVESGRRKVATEDERRRGKQGV